MTDAEADKAIERWCFRYGLRARKRGQGPRCPFEPRWAQAAWMSGYRSWTPPRKGKR